MDDQDKTPSKQDKLKIDETINQLKFYNEHSFLFDSIIIVRFSSVEACFQLNCFQLLKECYEKKWAIIMGRIKTL